MEVRKMDAIHPLLLSLDKALCDVVGHLEFGR